MESTPPTGWRSRTGRRLRLIIGTLAVILSLAFAAVWAASYGGSVECLAKLRGTNAACGIASYGRADFFVIELPYVPKSHAWIREYDPRAHAKARKLLQHVPSFIFGIERRLDAAPDIDAVEFRAPLWFLTALTAIVATLAFRPPYRFTIRTLLAALTVAALLLGGIVAETR